MRSAILFGILVFTTTTYAQKPVTKKTSTSVKSKPFELPRIAAPIIYTPPRMPRRYSSDSMTVYLSDTVEITNGKEEKIKVYFTGAVLPKVWDHFLETKDEKDFFKLIVSILSIRAQYTLKNTLSFEPFKNEFFMWDDAKKSFTCSYKMMGRNGYGNLLETSSLVEYDPVVQVQRN